MKPWWRIEVNASGKVVDCRQVEAPGEGGATVLYVRASSQPEAGRLAWNAYMRVKTRERRHRLIAEGKCGWCARENDNSGGQRCSVCKVKHVEQNDRRRRRVQGEDVPRPSRAAALAERAKEDRTNLRREVLLEVRKAWIAAHTMGQFTEWLSRELGALGVNSLNDARAEVVEALQNAGAA